MAIVTINSGSLASEVYYEYDTSATILGCGGMGRVYKGKSHNIKNGVSRDVAIKSLYEDLPDHVIARARREASIRLRNDSLVEMIDFLEYVEDGQVYYYVVSEYIDGISLDEFMSGNLKNAEGYTSPDIEKLHSLYKQDSCSFALKVVQKVLAGIMALHDAGYVHRDIDPSNIMITTGGQVKLIDFGIAKKIDTINTGDKQYTVSGQIIGKPFYAAPELVVGDIKNHNSTTDTYAIGILLYHLITGSVPFKGEIHEVIDKQLNANVPVQNIKNKAVRRIIKKATSKRQTQRYRSAAEFRVDLEMVDSRSSDIRPIKIIAVLVALLLIICAVVAIVNYYKNKTKPTDSDVIVVKEEISPTPYNNAIQHLKDGDSVEVKEGYDILLGLAEDGVYDAKFLLSRLYYESKDSKETIMPNSFGVDYSRICEVCEIKKDNSRAHKLLVEAIHINASDYKSWYELGCDYMSNNRGTKRSPSFAKYCYEKAKTLVDGKQSDIGYQQYVTEVNAKLDQLKDRKSEQPTELKLEDTKPLTNQNR